MKPRVIDEETWLTQQGASFLSIGDASLHRPPGSTPKSRHRVAAQQAKKDHALCIRRAELRKEYVELVEAGEIRPPTALERRIRTARGHPDNASVQAARRLLARRGIDWRLDEGSDTEKV